MNSKHFIVLDYKSEKWHWLIVGPMPPHNLQRVVAECCNDEGTCLGFNSETAAKAAARTYARSLVIKVTG